MVGGDGWPSRPKGKDFSLSLGDGSIVEPQETQNVLGSPSGTREQGFTAKLYKRVVLLGVEISHGVIFTVMDG